MTNELERLAQAVAERYRVQQELGRGGMATVYLAHDLKHRRQVALKVLRSELAATVGAGRFLREITLTAQLDHPHILPLLDSGQAEGFLYYVMPHVEGESLRDRLRREKQLPVDDALQITRQVADALSYAHSHGIVHRDIKPENILLAAGHARVADFGIARALTAAGGETLTETGFSVGTPSYMSPEQTAGGQAVDGRADIYSLACVTYEMLGGAPPFAGPTPQAIMARHAVDPMPSLRTIRPSLSPDVDRVLAKALAKVPADRFPTAAQFAEALQRAGAAPGGPLPLGWRSLRPWPLGARVVATVTVTLALLAVAVLGARMWLRVRSVPKLSSLAVLPFENLSGDSAQEYFADGMTEELITDLARIRALTVMSRFSVMQYKGTKKPPAEIARELRVDGLIQGSWYKSGDQVKVMAHLIDPGTSKELWAGSYQRPLRDVLRLQAEVAQSVVREMQVAVTPEETARLASTHAVNPQAYELYVQGRTHWDRLSDREQTIALEYFQRALEKDSNYALAYVGVGMVWAGRAQLGFAPPREAQTKAREAVLKALALDETLAEAHNLMGAILAAYDWDWSGAEKEARRALELDPNLANAHYFYSLLWAATGRREKGMSEVRRSVELDPLNPRYQVGLGWHLLNSGHYDEAIMQLQKTERLNPGWGAHRMLADAFRKKGMYREALDEMKQTEDREMLDALERGAARGGYPAAMKLAADVLAARAQREYVAPTQIAGRYARSGSHDEALQWLEAGFEARDPQMQYLAWESFWDNLWNEPRFQALLRRMNLPAATPP